jgi:ribonucleoside-diphosphate reductase alpha chain
MGIHEWLIKRGQRYEVTPELHDWLAVYRDNSNDAARTMCDTHGISRPVAVRAIAPTGSIGILASTTTGIEPLFAVAYKRRYLENGKRWKYQYVIDGTASSIIYGNKNNSGNINRGVCEEFPDVLSFTPDSAYDLAGDPERRIKFQVDVQDYVDQSISSTINLPRWGSASNCPDKVRGFASLLSSFAPRLRGFTAYPDGSRGGQPIEAVDYEYAKKHQGVVYEENENCKNGVCGI